MIIQHLQYSFFESVLFKLDYAVCVQRASMLSVERRSFPMSRQLLSFAVLSSLMFLSVPTGFSTPIIPGRVSQERVETLTSTIEWNESLKEAMRKAREQDKLILWVHMVGKIDGAT